MQPVARIERDAGASVSDNRVSTVMQLLDGGEIIDSLSAGEVTPDGVTQNGIIRLDPGESTNVTPWGGVFGEPGPGRESAPTLEPDHDYVVRVRNYDFASGSNTITSWPCVTSAEEKCEQTHTSYDAFRAFVEESDDPRLHFDLETTWCTLTGGDVDVLDTEVVNETLDSPFEAALEAVFTEVTTLNSSWTAPEVVVDENADGSAEVTATGEWRHCMGIPIIGKVKLLKKAPEALRVVSKLIKKARDGTDGKARAFLNALDKGVRTVAFFLEKAIEQGGALANKAVEKALDALAAIIRKAPDGVERTAVAYITAAVVDFSISAPWAQKFLRALPGMLASKVAEIDSPLTKLLSNKLICWTGWSPRVMQTVGTPGAEGTFVDVTSDPDVWVVQRHVGPFSAFSH